MRTLFLEQSIQQQLQQCFKTLGFEFLCDHSALILEFLSDEENTFADVPMFFQETLFLSQESSTTVSGALLDILWPHQASLPYFFSTEVSQKAQNLSRQTPRPKAEVVPPKAGSGHHSRFYFSAEDEEEVKKLAHSDPEGSKSQEALYDKIADNILKKLEKK